MIGSRKPSTPVSTRRRLVAFPSGFPALKQRPPGNHDGWALWRKQRAHAGHVAITPFLGREKHTWKKNMKNWTVGRWKQNETDIFIFHISIEATSEATSTSHFLKPFVSQEWTDGLGSRIMRTYQMEEKPHSFNSRFGAESHQKINQRSRTSRIMQLFCLKLTLGVQLTFFLRRALITSGRSLMARWMPFGLRIWTPCWMTTWLSAWSPRKRKKMKEKREKPRDPLLGRRLTVSLRPGQRRTHQIELDHATWRKYLAHLGNLGFKSNASLISWNSGKLELMLNKHFSIGPNNYINLYI